MAAKFASGEYQRGDRILVTRWMYDSCFKAFHHYCGGRSRGPQRHSCTALYISLVVLYRKYSRVRDNDFTAHGYAQAEAAAAKL